MGMDLKSRALTAGVAALALAASVNIGCYILNAGFVRIESAHDIYLNYVTTDALNDPISEFLDNNLLLESIQPDYNNYSTLDLVERESHSVHTAMEQDEEGSINKIEPFADKNKLVCKEYTFLTYKGLVSLFEEHQELKPHLKNIRIVAGLASDGRTEDGHVWLEVKVDDEWQTYDALRPFLNQPEWRDRVAYHPWVHFSMRDNGSVERTEYPLNILIHPLDATNYIFNALEDILNRKILDRPYTNLVDDFVTFSVFPLAAYGFGEYAWAIRNHNKKVDEKKAADLLSRLQEYQKPGAKEETY